MENPREVTAPSGKSRWLGADGRSFSSYEEAAATLPPPPAGPTISAPNWTQTISELASYLIILIAIPCFYLADIIPARFHWTAWLWLILLFFGFGEVLQTARNFQILITGRTVGAAYEPQGVEDWWMKMVVWPVVKAVVWIIGLVVLWNIPMGGTRTILLLFWIALGAGLFRG